MVVLLYNAGIRIREFETEVARLKRSLEIAHAYDGDGNQIPFPAGMEHLDGIACRDETIRQQDDQIEKLKAEIGRLTTGPANAAPVGDLAGLSERASEVVQRVAEWDDRTSPEDWPEAMLITGEELHKELVAFAQETAALLPAAHRETVGSDGWQSIETAPKDGSEILAARADIDDGFQQVVFWDTDCEVHGWGTKDSDAICPDGFFSHWRPLPAPPGQPSGERT